MKLDPFEVEVVEASSIDRHRIWGNFFAFLLMFLGWDALDAMITFLTCSYSEKELFAIVINVFLVIGAIPIITERSPFKSKRATGIASLVAALGVWNTLEIAIFLLTGDDPKITLIFYGTCLLTTILIVANYERKYKYDIVVNHLINS
jgi:uncharacterized MnhB-related membrane protein